VSGIAALWREDGAPVEGGELDVMLDAISYRGPDGRGTWNLGSLGLGHLLLRNTPESVTDHQPLQLGNLTLSASCRIDNRPDLLSRLELAIPPSNVTDAEIILRAYTRWGERCVDYLIGDFAFVLWDSGRQALFCARDPIGVEPLYYVHCGGLFACASEIRPLLTLPEIAPTLDDEGVAAYLVPFLAAPDVTLVRDVKRLPGGHTLTVDRSGSRLRRYWAPDPRRAIRLRSDGEYAEALRGVLIEAVRCRLRSTAPIGTMLSGGLDSSSVACIIRSLQPEMERGAIPAVSVLYPNADEGDERQWIEAVLADGGMTWHPVPWSGEILPAPEADVSFFSPTILVHRDAFQGAADAGVRVLLGGDGGDAALSWGNLALGSALSLFRAGYWTAGTRALVRPLYRFVRRSGGVTRQLGTDSFAAILAPEIAERLHVRERQRDFLSRIHRGSPRYRHALRLEVTGAAGRLEAEVALAARHGLELRSPFWDKRVLELCLALPAEQKESTPMPRMVLRRAMDGLLPSVVQWRHGKWAGQSPMADVLRRIRDESPHPPGMDDRMSRFLNPSVLRRYWDSLDRADVSADYRLLCWSVASLEAQGRAHRLV
jgi:asparagine synthase (glutamine-hydrolysing)